MLWHRTYHLSARLGELVERLLFLVLLQVHGREHMPVLWLIGLQFEEKDLVTYHGADYIEYRKRVPMIVPMWGKSKG